MRATTLRLPDRVRKEAEELASREGKAVAPFLRDLVMEGLKMRRVPGIVFVGLPPFREPMVAGTGLAVWEFVSLHRGYGEDEDRLLKDFPRFGRRHIQTARAYLRAYPEEVEEAIRHNERPIEEWMREYPFIRRLELRL